MGTVIRRAAVVAGAALVLLAPAAGVASAAGGAAAGTRPAVSQGATAGVQVVSCPSAGNCSAGGSYTASSDHEQAFVASEVHGSWGRAVEVPGIAALNRGGQAQITSVSCASAGNCSAGGFYENSSDHQQAFVVSEVHGSWGRAVEVPGIAAVNPRGDALTESVSCASAGNCSAGGQYTDRSGDGQVFVVSQVHGTWGKATEVPGIAASAKGGGSLISVSCASAGNCGAGGEYLVGSGASITSPVFVVSQVHGTWGRARRVRGAAHGYIYSVSCASAGNCSAGGENGNVSRGQAFVVSEVHGAWGTATEVPGTAALNRGRFTATGSLSCASAGNCSAGGTYYDSSHFPQAFVVTEAHGSWGRAVEVPGLAALDRGGNPGITEVSCGGAGNCSAGGTYADSSGHAQAFVVSEVHGTWGRAIEVPGTAALNRGGDAVIWSVSCASAGNCTAVGGYTDSSLTGRALVAGEVHGTWGKARELLPPLP